jgi:hypothetical protein
MNSTEYWRSVPTEVWLLDHERELKHSDDAIALCLNR